MNREHTLSLSEVKRFYLDVIQGREAGGKGWIEYQSATWRREYRAEATSPEGGAGFHGATAFEMAEWIKKGYKAPQFAHIDAYKQRVERKKTIWGEEGDELDLSKMFSGDPTPFSQREKREGKPGLKIVLNMAMACNVKPATIAEYGAWVAGLADSLGQAGYDLEVDVRFACRALMKGERGGQRVGNLTEIFLRLKKFGEQTDFAAWSPIFSPGGFRHLGFMSYQMTANHFGKGASGNLGYPDATGTAEWGMDWDAKDRVLTINCPPNQMAFPADKMTAEAKKNGII